MSDTKKKCAAFLAVFLLLLAALFAFTQSSFAATTWENLPSSTHYPTGNILRLSRDNVTVSYGSSADGKTYDVGNYKVFCVKITPGAAKEWSNPMTLTFTNVAEIGGRKLNCKVAVTRLKIYEPYGSSHGLLDGSYMGVLHASTNGQVGVACSTSLDGYYRSRIEVDTKVTITYADTGATVNLPFYQGIDDIDAGSTGTYYLEGIEFMSGYSTNIYKWPQCVLAFSGNKASATEGTSTTEDCWYKSGLLAPTTGGEFTCRWYEGACTTYLSIYGQYLDLENPTKTVDKEAPGVGDTVTWTVTQKIGKFYQDLFSPYSSFVLTDTLPAGLNYTGAKVYDGATDITTSGGTLSWDASSRRVTFTFSASKLGSEDFYKGQTIKMVITTTAQSQTADKVLTNTVSRNISGLTNSASANTTVKVAHGKLVKAVSENKKLTDLCPANYSLAGAEYGVYKSDADARSGSNAVATFYTDSSGASTAIVLDPGTYYVKETKAPIGFKADTAVHQITFTSGTTATVSVSDEPILPADLLMLHKRIKDPTPGSKINGKPLEGAEFEVKYYTKVADDMAGLSGQVPLRTWILKSDAAGDIKLDAAHKVSGDDLFVADDGSYVTLLGTYVMKETKAPAGYQLNDTVFVCPLSYNT